MGHGEDRGGGRSSHTVAQCNAVRRESTATFKAEAGFRELVDVLSPEEPFDTSRLDGDPGLFGPGSQTWTMWRERTCHVAAIRAMWLQTLHPLVLQAVMESDGFGANPMARVRRTVQWVSLVVFGARDEADRACEMLNAVHAAVSGTSESGREWRASDEDLMLWVHVTLVESFLAVHRRYGVTPLDEDAFVREWNAVSSRLGCGRKLSGVQDLECVMKEYRGVLVSDHASRATVQSVERTRVPRGAGMLLRGLREMAQSTLEPDMAAMCGLNVKSGRDVRCKLALWVLRKKPSRMLKAAERRVAAGSR